MASDLPVVLLKEIFLCLDDEADLVRASAACTSFRRVIFDGRFLRRFRVQTPATRDHGPAYRGQTDDASELQWRRMVDDLCTKGSLSNCIAVCDVSGSMYGTLMEVCVSLGLLISELSEEPWAGRLITFNEHTEIHMINGETLKDKLSFVRRMDWGCNTNFQAVFNRILSMAVDARLPREKMIRTAFVFSDMEFDQASKNQWESDYEAINRKFRDAGYGEVVPDRVLEPTGLALHAGDVDAARGCDGKRILSVSLPGANRGFQP